MANIAGYRQCNMSGAFIKTDISIKEQTHALKQQNEVQAEVINNLSERLADMEARLEALESKKHRKEASE